MSAECQSPKAGREHHLHGDTDESCGWRGDGDAKQWCNDHHYRRWRDFRNHDGSSKR
ncbi:hypothetical protein OK016_19375 [Vibrio chagasii]|nr:hypothetical protein [Vibrio chagasii]